MNLRPRAAVRGALFALSVPLVLSAPSMAIAQTIAIANPDALPRIDANGNPVVKRPLTLQPEGVNRQDCLADQRIRFPLRLTAFGVNDTLEAWATLDGTDCSSPTSRAGAVPACWKLPVSVLATASSNVDVPVRALLEGVAAAGGTDGARCSGLDLTNLKVQFLYFAGGEAAVPAASAGVAISVDTLPPPPPAGLRAARGSGGQVDISWASDAELTAAASVFVYCAPASTDDSGGAACTSTSLGQSSPVERASKAACATVVGAATAASVDHTAEGLRLAPGTTYAFTAAAMDGFGNVSESSPLACAAPEGAAGTTDVVDDGGGCSLTRRATAPWRSGGGEMAALVAGVALLLRRRRARAAFTS